MMETQSRRPLDSAELVPWFLSERLRELHLEIGTLIDRENSRPIPTVYADVLLETTLVVLIDQPIADALKPVRERLQADLQRAAFLHGSMYDQEYEVELRGAELPAGSDFRVVTRSGYRKTEGLNEMVEEEAYNTSDDDDMTILYVPPDSMGGADEDAPSWEPGRWVVRVSFLDGSEEMAFRLPAPLTTVGRRSTAKDFSVDIALDLGSRGVSRKQLAIEWNPGADGEVAFRVYNLGLASMLVDGEEVTGADVGSAPYDLPDLQDLHSALCIPGAEVLVGAPDIALLIEELQPEEDTEKTTVA